jgi:3-dehydroquinate synthase
MISKAYFWQPLIDRNMATFTIQTSGKASRILVGEPITRLSELIPPHAIIITDKVVNDLYGNHWESYKTIITGQGEKNKTLATIEEIFRQLLEYNVDRSGFILGIGGGIVCDIAGFVASTYMRGIRFGFVPTTLLAQVDASIGGKNGVNFQGFKNMVGTFNQPEFILSDPRVLKSLPAKECSNGFAEIVKHALIADEELFVYIEKHIDEMLKLNSHVINHLIKRSVEIKSSIVNLDEREKGERRKLNFGHTFGHAIEKVTGMNHGMAVSLGSVIASRFSLSRGYLKAYDFERILNVLEKLDLPIKENFNRPDILNALLKDKKREQDSIHFVLLSGIGHAVVEQVRVKDVQEISF